MNIDELRSTLAEHANRVSDEPERHLQATLARATRHRRRMRGALAVGTIFVVAAILAGTVLTVGYKQPRRVVTGASGVAPSTKPGSAATRASVSTASCGSDAPKLARLQYFVTVTGLRRDGLLGGALTIANAASATLAMSTGSPDARLVSVSDPSLKSSGLTSTLPAQIATMPTGGSVVVPWLSTVDVPQGAYRIDLRLSVVVLNATAVPSTPCIVDIVGGTYTKS